MRYGINTLDDLEVVGKTVLCRVDINSPIDPTSGELADVTRIKGCAPTLRELAEAGARVVVLAHQGGDLEYHNYASTEPHAKVLSELIGRPVAFIDDVCGPAARDAVMALADGDVLLLDNVRYCGEELTLFENKLKLSPEDQCKTLVVRKLAPLAELYVCDAFAYDVFCRSTTDELSAQAHLAARPDHSAQRAQQRGLAGAIGTQHSRNATLRDFQP